MAGFGDNKIEEVRARADIVEIIGAHVRLKRAGRNFTGLCPFHNEKTPSFSVNAERGFFHCFGCGVGGTVFDFVMRVEALTFGEALQSLARRYNIALPERRDGASGGAPAGERDALVQANQIAAEFFQHVLWNTHDGTLARDYLVKRGISMETAKAFLIGFAPARPANLAAVLDKRGLIEAAVKLGLVKREPGRPPYDMFRARVMFPIRDAQGRVIAFGGRVLDQRLPKYINSSESPLYSKARAVYGVCEGRQAIARADRAIVVEGYIDAIALWQAGFKETVASLGTALTVEQLRLLTRYTRNVVACFDGDAAGRKASLRALEIFLAAGLLGRGAFIPAGYDPDTMVRERGAQAFGELIDGAELLADYFLREQATAAGASMSARAAAAGRVAEILRMVANPFEFDLLARKAAGMLGVGEEILRREARKPGQTQSGNRAGRAPVPIAATAAARADGVAQAGVGLIAIALGYPALRAAIYAQAAPAEIEDRVIGALLEEVCLSDEAQASLEIPVMLALSDEQRGRLSALMVGPLAADADGARKLVADFSAALARGRRRREVESLRRAAATAGLSGDDAAAAAQAVIALRRQVHGG
ncbi:MAG TPA: DNA primase [Candidatus Binataceae bacterium]|nr:DNA primase [Candidatus Binataceae bacterium]